MKLYGMEKYSLVDYDGYVACTIFTGGCNFRCPFCHNAALVTGVADCPAITEQEVFDYLEGRRHLVDAVCITGGEPTLHPDLPLLIHKIRALGYKVKLDTNGTNPDLLSHLIEAGMLDYVAMDVKNTVEGYDATAGVRVDQAKIDRAIAVLMAGKCGYEFRTTVVKNYHTVEGIADIARRIEGAEQYYLQCFADRGGNLTDGLEGVDEATMRAMQASAAPYVKRVGIRGL
jgi:pyruvate formate lyase activating enzyme